MFQKWSSWNKGENYLNSHIHGQDDTCRGACFSPQKHSLLVDIANSEENWRCIMKKVKLKEVTSNFMVTDITTTTLSKLTLVLSQWLGKVFWILMILGTLL